MRAYSSGLENMDDRYNVEVCVKCICSVQRPII